jgi:hypothetical protein
LPPGTTLSPRRALPRWLTAPARAWRFAVDVVRDARAMEARYYREHRRPYRDS